MTRQQIADEMTRLKMTGGLLGFQTTRENLPDALRLLAHVMKEASFPADEYEQLQRQVDDRAVVAARQSRKRCRATRCRSTSTPIRRATRATTCR